MKIQATFLESKLAECIKRLQSVATIVSEFPFQGVYLNSSAQIYSPQGMSVNVNCSNGY